MSGPEYALCPSISLRPKEGFTMRMAALALVGALGFAASAMTVSAAPPVPNLDTQQSANIVPVAGGCGRGSTPTAGVVAGHFATATLALARIGAGLIVGTRRAITSRIN